MNQPSSPHTEPTCFIDEVLNALCEHPLYASQQLNRMAVVLPSHRAMSRLKKGLIRRMGAPGRLPQCFVLGGFIEGLSPWKVADPLEVTARLFALMKDQGEPIDFDRFVPWATVVLGDFAAVDQELKDLQEVFKNLADIQGIEDWSFGEAPWSEDQKKFDKQWRALPGRYAALNEALNRDGLATRAQITRHAAEHGDTDAFDHVLVAGLATMSTAEWTILERWNRAGKLSMLWDGDASYVDDVHNEAGRFIRQFRGAAPFPKHRVAQHPPAVKVVACQSMVGQTQYVRNVVNDLEESERSKTLIVLPDGGSLGTLLQALPPHPKGYNVTMGLALHETPVQSWVDKLFKVLDATTGSWRFEHVRDLHSHPIMRIIHANPKNRERDHHAFHHLAKNHVAWLKASHFDEHEAHAWAEVLRGLEALRMKEAGDFLVAFSQWCDAMEPRLGNALPTLLDEGVNPTTSPWAQAGWRRLRSVVGMLTRLQAAHAPMAKATEARVILRKMLRQERVDLLGEPDQGLQIMGLTETRALDYERVIVMDMNEGIVPQTSFPDSFLPADLRHALKMPGPRDREARFAYLVHRLLHRAKEIHLLHRASHDGHEGGEPSRYIMQFDGSFHDRDDKPYLHVEHLAHQLPLPDARPPIRDLVMTDAMRERLDAWVERGMSPSAINKMIACPREFAFRYLYRMGESADVETSMEANTLGSVVHHVMEHGLAPAVGSLISTTHLDAIAAQIDELLVQALAKEYNQDLVKRGENVLKLEIARTTILKFLRQERKEIVDGDPIPTIDGLEAQMTATVHHPVGGTMSFFGKMDRMETVLNQPRLVDYKSGKVTAKDLELGGDWPEQLSSGKHSKALQLMVYATIVLADLDPIKREQGVLAAIRSGKNVKSGLLSLVVDGEQVIRASHMQAFLDWLANELAVLRAPDHTLAHNPDAHYCEHCVVLDPKPTFSF